MQRWIDARDRGLAILIWVAIIFIVFWLLSHIVSTLLLLALSAVFAYALNPVVNFLDRRLPRWLAIVVVYVLAIAILGGMLFLVLNTLITQVQTFAQNLPDLLKPGTPDHPSIFVQILKPLGVTEADVDSVRNQVIAWAESNVGQITSQVVPFLTGVASVLVDLILVLVLSIYLVIDGPRLVRSLRASTPTRQRSRTLFILETLQRTVGGYIQGELLMAVLLGVLVGVGMFLFGLPYSLLLGVLAAFFEFVPILGTLVSGAACVLIALLAVNWLIAVFVLIYFVAVHILEGDILGPRIIGRALGLHPVVAIVALLAGTELFGIWGALFAAPVAGLIQRVLVTLWKDWRTLHPEAFQPSEGKGESDKGGEGGSTIVNEVIIITPAE
jgi:predicted PurR-regulated permease PerM